MKTQGILFLMHVHNAESRVQMCEIKLSPEFLGHYSTLKQAEHRSNALP